MGLPWTPPVAALAIVPATMSMARRWRMILSGFMSPISAQPPTNAIGQTANSGPRWGATLSPSPIAIGLPQHADEYRPERPVFLAVDRARPKDQFRFPVWGVQTGGVALSEEE